MTTNIAVPTRAAWGWLIFCSTLAVLAWLPVNLPALAPVPAAAGILLAASVPWSLRGIPRAARWVTAVLAFLVLAAFVYRIAATVAAGLVIGIALIAAVTAAAFPELRCTSPKYLVRQFVAVTTSFALLTAAIRGDGPHDEQFTLTPAERAGRLESSLRVIESSERTAPRDRWDTGYLVQQIGSDPQRIFEWVRSNTSWIPYRGVLRGPAGVLMDRRGNSLDRALLLAELLEKPGHSVRLAHREIELGDALRILPSALTWPTAPETDSLNGGTTSLRELAVSVVWPEMHQRVEAMNRAMRDMEARVREQTPRLASGLPRRDPRASYDAGITTAAEALRDHWWVQLQDGTTWTDLDPLRVETKPGAVETLTLAEAAQMLPRHEIGLRVVAEQYSGGTLSEKVVLQHTLRPSELLGAPVVLQFWPAEWLAQVSPASPEKVENLRGAALRHKEWGVGLMIGSDVAAAAILRENGEAPDVQAGGAMGGIGSRIAASFGASSGKTLTAVWIDYEMRVPGQSTRVERREVFDLVGPATRALSPAPKLVLSLVLNDEQKIARGLAMMMRTEILPLACQPAPEFVSQLMTKSLVDNREILRAAVRGALAPMSAATEQLLDQSAPTVSPLYSLALARFEWSRWRDWIYLDRPNIFTRHVYPVSSEGQLALRDATDIVANHIGVNPALVDAFAVRLEQGVLDTNAEAMVRAGEQTFDNAAEAFAAKGKWLTLTNSNSLDGLRLPDDTRSRVAEDLAKGYVVVAPSGAVPVEPHAFTGWWRVDPNTGRALGMGANGWGASTTERSTQHVTFTERAFAVFKAAGKRFASVFATAYGWCAVGVVGTSVEKGRGFVKGWVSTKDECLGDAIFLGALAAFPLVILSGNMRVGTPKPGVPPAEPKNPGPKAPEPCPPGGTSTGRPPSRNPKPGPEPPIEEANPMANSVSGEDLPGAKPTKQGSGNAPSGEPYDPFELPRPGTGAADPAEVQQRVSSATQKRQAAEPVESKAATELLEAQENDKIATNKNEEAWKAHDESGRDPALKERAIETNKAAEKAGNDLSKAEAKFRKAKRDADQARLQEAHWKRVAEANQKLLEAQAEQQAAENALNKNFRGFEGPEYDRWVAANKRLRQAQNDYGDAYWGKESGGAKPIEPAAPTVTDPNAPKADPGSKPPDPGTPPVDLQAPTGPAQTCGGGRL